MAGWLVIFVDVALCLLLISALCLLSLLVLPRVVRWPLIQTPSSDRLCVIQTRLKVNPLKNMTTGTVTLDCWTVSFGTSQIDLVRINDGD